MMKALLFCCSLLGPDPIAVVRHRQQNVAKAAWWTSTLSTYMSAAAYPANG